MSKYVKIPWMLQDDVEFWDDDHALATWLRTQLEAAKRQSQRHRPHLSLPVWRRILDRFGYRCAYCGVTEVPLQQDHRIAFSKGGPTTEDNIVPACQPCNYQKGAADPAEWPVIVQ